MLTASMVTSVAHAAEPETAVLRYLVAQPSLRCPDEESFRNQVAARLGYQPFLADGALDVRVHLRRKAARVRGQAEVVRPGASRPGVRTLEDDVEHCDAVVSALATAVAIAIDPVRGMGAPPTDAVPPAEPPEPSRPEPPPPTSAPPKATAPPPPVPSSAPPKRARLLVGAAGSASIGALPGFAVGGALGAGLRVDVWSVELLGRLETTPTSFAAAHDERLRATLLSAGLLPCVHRWRAELCASGRLGVVHGRAEAIRSAPSDSTLVGTVGARVGYLHPLTRNLTLRAALALEAPLVRTEFVVDRAPVWTAPPLFGGLDLGILFVGP